MKGGQDREEGAAGPVASGGSLDGAGSQAKIKPASKKRKSEATKASSAGPGSLKKAKESAKDAGQTSNSRLAGGTKKAAKDKEASGKDRDGATPKAKESNKKKKDTSATQQGQQQAPQTKSKDKKKVVGAGPAGAASASDKKVKKTSESVKKKKTVANGMAMKEDNKRQRKDKDESIPKEGNSVGSAVASNGWGFGTEVLTCLPRRVASLNAMAKVHIMYENETNRSTSQHSSNNNASSSSSSSSSSNQNNSNNNNNNANNNNNHNNNNNNSGGNNSSTANSSSSSNNNNSSSNNTNNNNLGSNCSSNLNTASSATATHSSNSSSGNITINNSSTQNIGGSGGSSGHTMAINSSSSGEVVAPPPSTGSSQPTTEVDTDSDVTIETVSTNNGHSSPRVDKIMMAVAVPGRCRRMASLNAQAILAASLCHDEKRPPKKKEPPPAPLTPTTFAPEAPAAATPAVSPRMTPAPGAAMGTPGTGGVVSGPAGSVIKIEDIEDEEKTTTVEEEEIVQIVQTTKIRRRKMKTSKSPSGGQPSPPATPRAAIKTKPLKKSEVLDGDTDDLLELAAMTGVVGKEEREQDIKVAQDSSATVTQAQQVTRTYTYTATSTASGGLTGVPSGVTPTALPAIVRPPLVISQAQSQPTTIPLQNQAASFSYAATVNAQNSNPQGGQAAQMQGGTMYMTNMNMANVAASMGNMATVAANVTNITNPGSYATIVTAPHFTVQQPVQASSTPFGIPTAYYQVQPLIHKPIAFHPNGAYVAGGQSTGGVGTVGGANSAAAAGQTRTPARSIVVQVPSTRQQQQQQQQQLAHNNSSGKPSSTSGIQVVVNNTNSGAGGPSGAVGGTAVNCGNSGLLNTSSNNKNNNSSNCNNKPQQQSQQQTQQRPTSIAQPATAGPAAAGAVSGGIPVQQQQQQQQKQQQQQQQTGGVTVLRNPGGRGGVANGGYGSGDVSSAAGGALGVRVSIETAAIACPLAAGAVGAIGGVNSGKRKMQGGPSGAAASGLGSAVAKCERVEKGDNQGREKKSGLLTGGIKVDAPIKTNSPGKRKYHGWSTLGEPFLKRVCTSNDQMHNALVRVCFPLMRHSEGDEVRPRDCVLLKSGPRVIDLPFVAKVGSLWQTTEGDLMISLLWYYRPEHTEQGRRSNHMEDEIFASKHCDFNSVACIEDKCYVLTFAEYCRYRAKVKQLEEGVRSRVAAIVPPLAPTPRQARLPDPGRVSADLVFFCRKVYDYRQKRILKNPTVQIIAKDPNGVGGEGNA